MEGTACDDQENSSDEDEELEAADDNCLDNNRCRLLRAKYWAGSSAGKTRSHIEHASLI